MREHLAGLRQARLTKSVRFGRFSLSAPAGFVRVRIEYGELHRALVLSSFFPQATRAALIFQIMKRDNDDARARRVAALAAGEQNVLERLAAIKSELDGLTRSIDRLTIMRRPRMHAGGADQLGNILRLSHRMRGILK
jgi:hypothetical protein